MGTQFSINMGNMYGSLIISTCVPVEIHALLSLSMQNSAWWEETILLIGLRGVQSEQTSGISIFPYPQEDRCALLCYQALKVGSVVDLEVQISSIGDEFIQRMPMQFVIRFL
jgi:hypothetical protein